MRLLPFPRPSSRIGLKVLIYYSSKLILFISYCVSINLGKGFTKNISNWFLSFNYDKIENSWQDTIPRFLFDTVRKMSKYGVFLVHIFLYLDWIRTRKSSIFEYFSCSVIFYIAGPKFFKNGNNYINLNKCHIFVCF